jgi:hypothetical protein
MRTKRRALRESVNESGGRDLQGYGKGREREMSIRREGVLTIERGERV